MRDFSYLLDGRQRLRSRRDLHEAHLHYGFSLFLLGEEDASDKLTIALQLDPEYRPSPVTLRPDLLEFYQGFRRDYLERNGTEPLPLSQVFPEFSIGGARRVLRRPPFVPLLGVELRRMGHPDLGHFLGATELSSGLINAASIAMRFAVFNRLDQTGDSVREASLVINIISVAVFWPALIADIAHSFRLRRTYRLNPDLRPRLTQRDSRLLPAPRVQAGPGGVGLAFW